MWDCSLGGMAHGWRVGVGGAEGKEVWREAFHMSGKDHYQTDLSEGEAKYRWERKDYTFFFYAVLQQKTCSM